MPTAISHAVVAIAAGRMCFARRMPAKFWLLSMGCSALPDLDTGLHAYGVLYEDVWGHRGMMHSLLFAAGLALVVVSWAFRTEAPWLGRRWCGLFAYFFLLIASHGVLDMLTDGGLGIALFSPFDTSRYFFPCRPIEVAPIGLRTLFTLDGWHVIRSEMLWVWLPCVVMTGAVVLGRRIFFRRA